MCGIAGIINATDKLNPSFLEQVSKSMIHRGPDDGGIFSEHRSVLVHRRLSIIDLTHGGQPIYNEDRSLVIIFNGEIYNFKSLRQELETKGHIFCTGSDTEVILHAYEEWGDECLSRFSGMFVFAIYNRINSSLFLARDRCGEKPLYYRLQGETLIFASEIQTLLLLAGKNPDVDFESVYLYLRLGYIPSPRSFYLNIKKLDPGAMLLYTEGIIKLTTWYQPGIKGQSIRNIKEDELCDELDEILCKAVQKMLISDVPLGAFLSGGIDSSLIVAIMAKFNIIHKTFSIGFTHASFDETEHACKIANFIGSDHTTYTVQFGDFESSLSIMDHIGEPFADYSAIPSWYLSRLTRSRLKVALSGDGADELFGGYRRYFSQQLADFYRYIPSKIRQNFIAKLFSYFPDSDLYYADSPIKSARMFLGRFESENGGLMRNTVFSDKEIISLFPDFEKYKADFFFNEEDFSVEALMLSDRKHYLPDDIMVKVDRMSMQHSLEVRSPYLDKAVLNFSDRIPLNLKIKGLTGKYILKKVALRYLPKDIVFRKKHGFVVPMAQWLNTEGKDRVESRIPPQIETLAITKLLSDHFEKRIDCSHKLFSLIMLGRFLK